MAIFNEAEAKHFFSLPIAAPSTSFKAWSEGLPAGFLAESQPAFNEFRSLAHREVERSLLLAASHYRRAHDVLSPIAAPWAFVTLYYGSFFAARALLGALGAWKLKDHRVLQVVTTTPLSQRFQVHNAPSAYRGSHQRFWEFYFSNVVSLIPAASLVERFALQPVSADITWLISRRNDLNYDSFHACELAELHAAVFNPATFPTSLPGVLNTKFRFLESLLVLTNRICKSVGINSDAVAALSAEPTRSKRARAIVISKRPPGMAAKVKKKVAIG
jgi:hypothetical protein